MAVYIMLFRFTTKGVEKIKESPKRIQDGKKVFEAAGAKVRSVYAVLGQYDTVWIVDAPNDETIARLSLQLASLGNVHVETLRAFDENEFATMVKEIA